MLGLTEEQSSDFSDLEDGSEDAVHELSVMVCDAFVFAPSDV